MLQPSVASCAPVAVPRGTSAARRLVLMLGFVAGLVLLGWIFSTQARAAQPVTGTADASAGPVATSVGQVSAVVPLTTPAQPAVVQALTTVLTTVGDRQPLVSTTGTPKTNPLVQVVQELRPQAVLLTRTVPGSLIGAALPREATVPSAAMHAQVVPGSGPSAATSAQVTGSAGHDPRHVARTDAVSGPSAHAARPAPVAASTQNVGTRAGHVDHGTPSPSPRPADGVTPSGASGSARTVGQMALLPLGEPEFGSLMTCGGRVCGLGGIPHDRPEDVQVFPA